MMPPGYGIEVRRSGSGDCVRCPQTGHEIDVADHRQIPRAALALATLTWLEHRLVMLAMQRAERPN